MDEDEAWLKPVFEDFLAELRKRGNWRNSFVELLQVEDESVAEKEPAVPAAGRPAQQEETPTKTPSSPILSSLLQVNKCKICWKNVSRKRG